MRVFSWARHAVVVLAVGLVAGSAQAARIQAFDQAQFAAAQNEGGPIVIDITASWCPTCRAQKPIIDSLAQNPDFASLIIFEVDFDKQEDVVRRMRASTQSTLIAFNGRTEMLRSVGATDQRSIEQLLRAALGR
jgi:thiol-disulfide isomerase/thioredoxin